MPYIIAIAVIVVAGIAFAFLQNKDAAPVVTTEEAPIVETTQATPGENAPATSGLAASDYKNGTYTSQVTYLTPKRDEYLLDITLTVADDIITDATIAYSQGAEIDPNAQRFEAAYKAEIIGKDLGDINLSRVGGASLTTGAFNNALIEIKADAKS